MTVASFAQTPPYLVEGIGPYEISCPYTEGAIIASVLIDGRPVALDPDQVTIEPVASDAMGSLYLSADLATEHAGRTIWIDRVTEPVQGWEARYGDREVGMERQLDRDTMAIQELRAELGATLRGRAAAEPYSPTPGRVPIFRADGTGWEDGPDSDAIYQAADNAEQALQARIAAEAAAEAAQAASDGITKLAPNVSRFTADGLSRQFLVPGIFESTKYLLLWIGGEAQPRDRFTVAPDYGGNQTLITWLGRPWAAGEMIPKGWLVEWQAQFQVAVQIGEQPWTFATVAGFETAVAGGFEAAAGVIVYAGSVPFVSAPDETAMARLPGWLPAGLVTANHFGAMRGRTVPAQAAFADAAAYLYSIGSGALTALPGEYLITADPELPCGVDLADTFGRVDLIVQQPVRPLNTDQTVAAYTGQVANRCRWAEVLNAAFTKAMARSAHVAADDISSLQVVFAAAYIDSTTVAETPLGAAMSVSASIEYPAGTFTQVKFGGVASGSVASGAMLTSDAVAVAIPRGAIFHVRQFLQCASGVPYQAQENPIDGDGLYLNSAATDLTMSGDVPVNAGGQMITPVAIIGATTRRSYALIGDSRVRGHLDTAADARGAGSIEPSMRGAGAINLAYNGSKASDYLASHALRDVLVGYCSDIMVSYGINDLASGVAAPTLLANIASIRNLYPSKRAHAGTIYPRSTSSDGWATVSGQTPFAQEAGRQAVNAAIRAGIAGFATIFDTAAAVEDRNTPGAWKPHLTDDGIHANGAGHREIRLGNTLTGGLNGIYMSTQRTGGLRHSKISGIKFSTLGGDGGAAIYTEQDNGAFYATGAHVIVERCAFAEDGFAFPASGSPMPEWGWGRAFALAHSNGSAFRDNDVIGGYDPTRSRWLQAQPVGVELATDGTSGIIAVSIADNRLWYCHTAMFVGEDVLAFWFSDNECIKCYEGVIAPADPLGDGSVSQADTLIEKNKITVQTTAINLENRQMFHLLANHTNSDAAYVDPGGAGFRGIRLANCTKYKLRGNSANLAAGHVAWAGKHRAIELISSSGGTIVDQSVSRYFHDAVHFNASSDVLVLGSQFTQLSDAAYAFTGTCRNIDIGKTGYVTAEPTQRLRFNDADTNIHNFGSIQDEWTLPMAVTAIVPSAGAITVTRRSHIVTITAATGITTITGPNVRDGLRLTLRPSSSAFALTLTQGGNLHLAGNWVSTNARDTIELEYSNALAGWLEISRSINGA